MASIFKLIFVDDALGGDVQNLGSEWVDMV